MIIRHRVCVEVQDLYDEEQVQKLVRMFEDRLGFAICQAGGFTVWARDDIIFTDERGYVARIVQSIKAITGNNKNHRIVIEICDITTSPERTYRRS